MTKTSLVTPHPPKSVIKGGYEGENEIKRGQVDRKEKTRSIKRQEQCHAIKG